MSYEHSYCTVSAQHVFGQSWRMLLGGILLKLINCQSTQTADHPFRYQEKEMHKQLNKHLSLYPPLSTISACCIFSTGYTQSSRIPLGRGQVAGRLSWSMHNSFLLLWTKYFSATLWPSLSCCAFTAFMVSRCSIPPGVGRPQPQSLGMWVPLWHGMTPQLLVPLIRTPEQDHKLLQHNGRPVSSGFSHCCFHWSQFWREEHLAKWMKTLMPLSSRARADPDFWSLLVQT